MQTHMHSKDPRDNTGRGKLLSARELMAELNVGRSWLRKQEQAGMPRVCLNPDSIGTHGRRYRYDLQAVMDWIAARNAAAPTPCAPTTKKGVDA